MAARIPQHVREEQIKSLCEGTIYSFVGWEGEYKNKYSKFICSCSKHGQWPVTVDSFTNNDTRCSQCGIDANGLRYAVPKEKREKQIRERCEVTSYIFNGWVDVYKNNESKICLTCPSHGDFIISFSKFALMNQGCRQCGRERQVKSAQIDESIREKQIENRCFMDGYIFKGWVNSNRKSNAKVRIECIHHGEWLVSVSHFLNHRTGCPSCNVPGFKSNQPGFLYLLASEGGQHLKVGITNNKERRIKELRRDTPFDFHLLRIKYFKNGRHAADWEKSFHDSFTSSGLKNFDGATEWLKWNPEIPQWFDLI